MHLTLKRLEFETREFRDQVGCVVGISTMWRQQLGEELCIVEQYEDVQELGNKIWSVK